MNEQTKARTGTVKGDEQRRLTRLRCSADTHQRRGILGYTLSRDEIAS